MGHDFVTTSQIDLMMHSEGDVTTLTCGLTELSEQAFLFTFFVMMFVMTLKKPKGILKLTNPLLHICTISPIPQDIDRWHRFLCHGRKNASSDNCLEDFLFCNTFNLPIQKTL